jgi:hypothetical protein
MWLLPLEIISILSGALLSSMKERHSMGESASLVASKTWFAIPQKGETR